MRTLKDNVRVKFVAPDGTVRHIIEGSNRIVNTGLALAASRLVGSTMTPVSFAGIGTGTVAVDPGDTALGTATGTRVPVVISALTKNVTNDGFTATATFPDGNPVGGAAVTEAGLFNADDVMLARFVFSVYNKGADDTVVLEWDVWNEYVA